MKCPHDGGHPLPKGEEMGGHGRIMSPCRRILPALMLLAGCIPFRVASDIAVNDKLQATPPLEPGDVILIFGENAAPREENFLLSYIKTGCPENIRDLVKNVLKVNPQPGRFAVRYVEETMKHAASDRAATSSDSILQRLDLTKDVVSRDRLRYAVHVEETFEERIHVPLYLPPLGVFSSGTKVVLEAGVWDLSAERFLGSFTVTAEGESTVFAYGIHLIVERRTQEDALEKLAREIVARLAGLKPLDINDD